MEQASFCIPIRKLYTEAEFFQSLSGFRIICHYQYVHTAFSSQKIVCSVISVASASTAVSSIWRRNNFSSSFSSSIFPVGYGIAMAGTTLLAPTLMEIGVTVHTCTAGIPCASVSLTIVAPQRVQVPQAEVRMIPSTFIALSSAAIFSKSYPLPRGP